MSRAGDSPSRGPEDGDAFAVFAAFAPSAWRILEIDPDLLVDQAAELDDDAFEGFSVLTTRIKLDAFAVVTVTSSCQFKGLSPAWPGIPA
jgi:hypothetical protein